uniref:cGMP-dependent protein kinase interacting domain-containing protein n=1 Tax=Ciona savignyi TaxID=51511 RepID=H2YC36_CIOSA
MSVEYLYEHEYRRSQGDPVNLLRTRDPTNTSNHSSSSQNPVIASAVSRNVKSASEQRLERIEYEMRLLQDKLRQEQERKNALEDEVALLRRDNTRLQNHACVRSVVGKVKSSQSN